jgi:mannose-1-phosphate guanylyltransferase
MFIWRADAILTEIRRQMPNLATVLDQITVPADPALPVGIPGEAWTGLKTETVDYGIMEHADRVAVLPAGGLGWSDVGMWSSLFEVLLPDMNGNITTDTGSHLAHETHNTLVYGGGTERLVVTIGVDDMVIVDTSDVLLVCKTDQSQRVREVVEHLRKHRQERYL